MTIQTFVGHRLWRLRPYNGVPVLGSVTSGDPWLRRDHHARCLSGDLLVPEERRSSHRHTDGVSPAVDCSCGIYASIDPPLPPHRRVWGVGEIEMWGRVIEGTTGYRAQHARLSGDVEVLLGMGRGSPKCTLPPCREPATCVWQGRASFLARCDRHSRGGAMTFDAFAGWVDEAFRRRYGIGACLARR